MTLQHQRVPLGHEKKRKKRKWREERKKRKRWEERKKRKRREEKPNEGLKKGCRQSDPSIHPSIPPMALAPTMYTYIHTCRQFRVSD